MKKKRRVSSKWFSAIEKLNRFLPLFLIKLLTRKEELDWEVLENLERIEALKDLGAQQILRREGPAVGEQETSGKIDCGFFFIFGWGQVGRKIG